MSERVEGAGGAGVEFPETGATSVGWVDTPEKVAWRALIPKAAQDIAGFYTPDEQVGEGLAEVLALRVLQVAYRHRAELLYRPEGER